MMLLWIIAGVTLLFVTPVSYFFIWKPKTKNNMPEKLCAQFVVLFYAGAMIFCLTVKFDSDKFKQNKKQEIKEKSENYTLYVDGVQVNKDKVNIGSYSVAKAKINDEKQEIYFSTGKED